MKLQSISIKIFCFLSIVALGCILHSCSNDSTPPAVQGQSDCYFDRVDWIDDKGEIGTFEAVYNNDMQIVVRRFWDDGVYYDTANEWRFYDSTRYLYDNEGRLLKRIGQGNSQYEYWDDYVYKDGKLVMLTSNTWRKAMGDTSYQRYRYEYNSDGKNGGSLCFCTRH